MNIVPIRPRGPVRDGEPCMSRDLEYEIDNIVKPREAVRVRNVHSAEVQQEATRLQEDYDRLTSPPTWRIIASWVAPISAAVGNPPSEADLNAKIGMIAETSGDLPVGVWTVANRSLLLRTINSNFFPSANAIDKVLRPIGEVLLAKRAALQKIVGTAVTSTLKREADRLEPTQTERDAVRAIVA